MRLRRLCNIVLALLLSVAVFAHETDSIPKANTKAKAKVYNSTQIKLDILSPVLIAGLNNWQIQHYEIAANVQLAHRFFPTLELGYATPGGFARIGCDINPLKKHPESPHAMLVGVRIGTAVQPKGYTDCWGEIVAGCQVEVWESKRPIAKGQQPISYEVCMARKDSFKLIQEAAERQRDFQHDLLILTASRDYGLDDILFGPPERKAIQRALVPVMLINPREDLFSLCD